MEKECVAHIQSGISLSCKQVKIMKSTCKWVELENTLLSEVTQTRTQTLHGLSQVESLASKLVFCV